MNEVICPHCHKAFKIDEAGYADILKQVRDSAFKSAHLHERLELAEKDKQKCGRADQGAVNSELRKQPQPRMLKSQAFKPR